MSPAPYLILGGTTRAASSALFTHLAAHPHIAPARLKEPRFFLDPDYPLEAPLPFARGLAAYEALFPARSGLLRLEATPDYLHSPGTARRLARALPEARVVFTLRDPRARLLSWYRYARAAGRLPRGLSLAQYVERQRRDPPREQPFLALAQGHYAEDLERWFAALGRARVHVHFYEELLAAPTPAFTALAAFAGLEPGPLARPFALENAARPTRSPALHRAYLRLAFRLRQACATRPRLFAALRRAHRLVKPLYLRANAGRETSPALTPELEAWLTEHYRPSAEHLERLLGRRPPWLGLGREQEAATRAS
jgi:hypothetical protein